MRGLLTAYGTFMGREQNQSLLVLEALRERGLELDCDLQLWPVVLPTVCSLVDSALAMPRLRYWLALGEGAREGLPKLETRAYNRFDLRHDEPSAGGEAVEGLLESSGSSSIRAHWPAAQLATALGEARHPVQLSNDPGSHCCNALLYWGTQRAQKLQPRPWVGFLHLPRQEDKVEEFAQMVEFALLWLDEQFL
jgi:pyroglutamyl-peptidase